MCCIFSQHNENEWCSNEPVETFDNNYFYSSYNQQQFHPTSELFHTSSLCNAPCIKCPNSCLWCLCQLFPLTSGTTQWYLAHKHGLLSDGESNKEYHGCCDCFCKSSPDLSRKWFQLCYYTESCLLYQCCCCIQAQRTRGHLMRTYNLRNDPIENYLLRCMNCISCHGELNGSIPTMYSPIVTCMSYSTSLLAWILSTPFQIISCLAITCEDDSEGCNVNRQLDVISRQCLTNQNNCFTCLHYTAAFSFTYTYSSCSTAQLVNELNYFKENGLLSTYQLPTGTLPTLRQLNIPEFTSHPGNNEISILTKVRYTNLEQIVDEFTVSTYEQAQNLALQCCRPGILVIYDSIKNIVQLIDQNVAGYAMQSSTHVTFQYIPIHEHIVTISNLQKILQFPVFTLYPSIPDIHVLEHVEYPFKSSDIKTFPVENNEQVMSLVVENCRAGIIVIYNTENNMVYVRELSRSGQAVYCAKCTTYQYIPQPIQRQQGLSILEAEPMNV